MLNKITMILMTILFTRGTFSVWSIAGINNNNTESLTQKSQCTHGDVQLVGTPLDLRSRGIVEICINSKWGKVCGRRDNWSTNDAAVVCKQLGYGPEGKCLNCTYDFLTCYNNIKL